MRLPRAILAGVASVALAAQADLPPELLLLSRIKRHVRESLSRLPNYTCLETTDRSIREIQSLVFRPLDSVRLDVSVIQGKEFHAPPGGGRVQEGHISDYVTAGAIGDGAFSTHARSIFINDLATFQYAGEEDLAGRRTVRYNYRISAFRSGYIVSTNGHQAVVACRGSFWVDRNSLDLLRLEVDGDEIPPELETTDLLNRIDYARVRIGAADVMLPQSAEMTIVHTNGSASRNLLSYTHCREYSSESSISFGAPPPETAEHAAAAPRQTVDLPPGLAVPLTLDTPIDSARSAVGDLLHATSTADAKIKNKVIVPAGARLTGRIRGLDRYTDPESFFEVGLEFTQIEFGNSRADFYADLQSIAPVPGLEWLISRSHSEAHELPGMGRLHIGATDQVRARSLPGVGNFLMRGAHFQLPSGLRMVWKTRQP
jgi:hypothetical protein